MSFECIELVTGRVQFGAGGIEILLEGVVVAKHRIQLVVHFSETDCAKNGIPIGVTKEKMAREPSVRTSNPSTTSDTTDIKPAASAAAVIRATMKRI